MLRGLQRYGKHTHALLSLSLSLSLSLPILLKVEKFCQMRLDLWTSFLGLLHRLKDVNNLLEWLRKLICDFLLQLLGLTRPTSRSERLFEEAFVVEGGAFQTYSVTPQERQKFIQFPPTASTKLRDTRSQ